MTFSFTFKYNKLNHWGVVTLAILSAWNICPPDIDLATSSHHQDSNQISILRRLSSMTLVKAVPLLEPTTSTQLHATKSLSKHSFVSSWNYFTCISLHIYNLFLSHLSLECKLLENKSSISHTYCIWMLSKIWGSWVSRYLLIHLFWFMSLNSQ